MNDGRVTWSRVKGLLDELIERWERTSGRAPYLNVIHGGGFSWETPQQLASCVTFGLPLIEPGKPGRETYLVTSLTKGFKSFPRMPHPGPYMSEEHVAEIARWIDDGMPED